MNALSRTHYEQARMFLKTKARPLDRALFEYEFESGSADAVLKELAHFQNADGGFGRGLEPDIRCEASSAIATTIALQVLLRLPIDETNDMLQAAIHYLLSSYDPNKKGWDIVPREVETAPRAPWWNYLETRTDWGNPNAEILGYLKKYHTLVPAGLIETLTVSTIDYITGLETYEFHELLCFLRLADQLTAEEWSAIQPKMQVIVEHCVDSNPENWGGYSLQPIQVVTSPQSPYFDLYANLIPANLAHLIAQQSAAGCWEPTWSWGQFEDAWTVAKDEWCGRLTLENLRTLRAFGYLER